MKEKEKIKVDLIEFNAQLLKDIKQSSKNHNIRNFANVIDCDFEGVNFICEPFCEESKIEAAVLVKSNGGVEVNEKSIDFDDFFYGVSPKISEELIINNLLSLHTFEGIKNFIVANCEHFALYKEMGKYLIDLAYFIVLSMARNFCVKIYGFDKEQLDNITKSTPDFKEGINYKCEGDDCLVLIGCLTYEIIVKLNKYSYEVQDNKIHLGGKDKFEEVYENCIQKYNTHSYYSGVLLNVKNIEKSTKYLNGEKISYTMKYHKCCFATVDAFDRNHALFHPFFDEQLNSDDKKLNRDVLHEFFSMIDKKRKKLIKYDVNLETINDYLKDNFAIHQIGVSSNIYTSDGYLIFTKRSSSGVIDSDMLYPASNGNVEIYDDSVDFYKRATSEDVPTLDSSKKYFRLQTEIQRETLSELQLDYKISNFKQIGLVIQGFTEDINQDSKNVNRRRMHFNILYELNCKETLKQVELLQKSANESFEAQNGLVGVKYTKKRNLLYRILSKSFSFLKYLFVNNYIISILALLFFLLQFVSLFEDKSEFLALLLKYIEAVVNACILISIVFYAVINFKKKKTASIKNNITYNNIASKPGFNDDFFFEKNNMQPATICLYNLSKKKLEVEKKRKS